MACTPKCLRREFKAMEAKARRAGWNAAQTKARRMKWLRGANYPGVVHHRRKVKRPWLEKEE